MTLNGLDARYLSCARTALKIRKRLRWRRGDTNRVYFHQRVQQYRAMWQAVAAHVGAHFTELAPNTWEISLAGRRTRVVNHKLECDNPVVLDMAGDKPLMHRLLQAEGLAVPAHAVFRLSSLDTLYEFQARHPEGCVVKPADGSAGLGVTTHVESKAEARQAALLASLYGESLLVEAQIPGECYRLLVLGGRMVHAVCRRGPRLEGDGRTDIATLIARQRSQDSGVTITVDRNCLFTLASQGLRLDAVPAAGRVVLVKTIPDDRDRYVELRTVYTETVTDRICPAVREAAERAAAVLGSEFLGVDVITPDPTVPLEQAGGVINEVNTTPALHHHYDRDGDPYPAVAPEVLRYLLRDRNRPGGA